MDKTTTFTSPITNTTLTSESSPLKGTITFESTNEHSAYVLSSKMIALTVALSAILPVLLYLYYEYLAFISLGPGGTPQNAAGFLKVFLLSFARVTNPYELPDPPAKATRTAGHLCKLPPRLGPRPQVRGIAPQRQITQQGNAVTHELLIAKMEQLGVNSKDIFIGTSCFEKHSTGLFALYPVNNTCAGEICHTHPSDGGSMHLTLHPADAKVVLEAGWGERHPLSRGGWFERFVPAGFVMIYAPRDEVEVETVMQVVGAAAWYVCGSSTETASGATSAGLQKSVCQKVET